MATTETLPLGIDVSALIGTDTPTGITAEMVDTRNGVTAAVGAPTLVGNVITTVVTGSALEPQTVYRLSVTFTAGDATWTSAVTITVPF